LHFNRKTVIFAGKNIQSMKTSEALRRYQELNYKDMEKVKAIVERGKDGKFSVYMDNYDYEFGLAGFGNTVNEAIEDFYNSYKEEMELNNKEGKKTPDLEFNIEYDASSSLNLYSDKKNYTHLQKV
jgi:hypothetical protein